MQPMFRRVVAVASLLLTAAGAGSCAPVHVSSFTETGVRFNFRTYAWAADDPASTGDPRLDNNRFFSERVRDSVDRELAARGFEKTTLKSPDLVVHYHATITQEIERSGPYDRFEHCASCGPTVHDAGTLVIDLVDGRTARLIWRGWAEKVDPAIDNQDWMEKAIDLVVTTIMKKLPPRS